MITVKSTINIAGQTVPQIIPVVQGDTGRSILFTLADFTIPQGSTATYYVQKPSGEAVYNVATIDGNTVLVELTAQSIIEHGDNYGQVRIENDGEIVTSFDFILLVKPFRGIDATQSTTEMNIFDKAVEQAEEAIDEAKDAALEEIAEAGSGNIAEEFDAANSYLAGEYTIYNAKLYRFTSNHTGAWSGSDAEEVTVGDELTDVKDGLTAVESDVSDLKDDLSDMDDRVTALEEGGSGSGLTDDIKQALLQLAEKVAYIDEDGQDYYDALESALYPPADLVSISCVYTQSGTVYDTDSLDSLKSDLVVTAHMSDSTTQTVTAYTLSGTLTQGTSTITVSYGGKTTTFNVTVTASPQYVTDGLIAYWDGIDNTGSGHDSSALKWVDLVNGYELNLRETTYTTWGTDCINFAGDKTQGLYTDTQLWTKSSTATIEFVLKPEATSTQVVGNFDVDATGTSGVSNKTSRRFVLYADNTIGFRGASGNTYTNSASALTAIRKMVAEYTDFTVDNAWVNGTALSLSSNTHSLTFSNTPQYRIGIENLQNGANNTYPLTGSIYAIRVYNRKLTSEELAKNLNYDNTRFSLGVTSS